MSIFAHPFPTPGPDAYVKSRAKFKPDQFFDTIAFQNFFIKTTKQILLNSDRVPNRSRRTELKIGRFLRAAGE